MRVVLILSMIGSGSSLFSSLVMTLGLPTFKSFYESGLLAYPGEMTVFIEQLLETPRAFFLCSTLLYAMSLAGVILMWNIRRSGFHLYTLAQLLILLVTVLFLGRERLMLGDIMFSLLFIVYYFIALRQLDALKQSAAQNKDAENEPHASEENENGEKS